MSLIVIYKIINKKMWLKRSYALYTIKVSSCKNFFFFFFFFFFKAWLVFDNSIVITMGEGVFKPLIS